MALAEGSPQSVRVYLATAEAFSKNCRGCKFLAKMEEVENSIFRRVYCKAEECVRRS